MPPRLPFAVLAGGVGGMRQCRQKGCSTIQAMMAAMAAQEQEAASAPTAPEGAMEQHTREETMSVGRGGRSTSLHNPVWLYYVHWILCIWRLSSEAGHGHQQLDARLAQCARMGDRWRCALAPVVGPLSAPHEKHRGRAGQLVIPGAPIAAAAASPGKSVR